MSEDPKPPERRFVELTRTSHDVLSRIAAAMERQADATEKILAYLQRTPSAASSPASAPRSGGAGSGLTFRMGKTKGESIQNADLNEVRKYAHFLARTWFTKPRYADANKAHLEEVNAILVARGSTRIEPEEPPDTGAGGAPPEPTYRDEPQGEPARGGGGPADDDIPF